MKEKVEAILGRIRPSPQADGGDVELVEVSPDGVVTIILNQPKQINSPAEGLLKLDTLPLKVFL